MEKVYHSSENKGLKELKPKESTHKISWIYATKDIEMSSVFLSNVGGDFTCFVGRDKVTNKVYICERFKGAFDYRYGNKKGSIYVLPGDSFMDGKTSCDEEVVSEVSVKPLEEIEIEDVKEYLLELEKKGSIIIKYYPEKIDDIPLDDEDIVKRGIIWTRQFGDKIIEQVKKYHPNLLERVQKGIEEGKYIDNTF